MDISTLPAGEDSRARLYSYSLSERKTDVDAGCYWRKCHQAQTQQAANYLIHKGYTIIERDWKSGHRDIDIIATDGEVVVFVEVKARRNRVFGEPEDAVDYMKMQNLRAAINHYIKYKNVRQEIRFDVITVVGTPYGGEAEITHIEDVPTI